jgi:hypothetical protein
VRRRPACGRFVGHLGKSILIDPARSRRKCVGKALPARRGAGGKVPSISTMVIAGVG